jgi:squalene monooxygenase
VDIPNGIRQHLIAEDGVPGYIRTSVIPRLPENVQEAAQVALQHGKLRSMPNSCLPPGSSITPGALLLGDAANMRHPLTGGGMTVALQDVVTLSKLLRPEALRLSNAEAVVQTIRRFHKKRKSYSISLNILAHALYGLFITEGMRPPLPVLQTIDIVCS